MLGYDGGPDMGYWPSCDGVIGLLLGSTIWAKFKLDFGPRLKEMGLEGAMGGMGSGCLQLRFQIFFDVLALIFSKNVRFMQGQFLKKIDLNTFPSIYVTFSRSKPKKFGEFFNQRLL